MVLCAWILFSFLFLLSGKKSQQRIILLMVHQLWWFSHILVWLLVFMSYSYRVGKLLTIGTEDGSILLVDLETLNTFTSYTYSWPLITYMTCSRLQGAKISPVNLLQWQQCQHDLPKVFTDSCSKVYFLKLFLNYLDMAVWRTEPCCPCWYEGIFAGYFILSLVNYHLSSPCRMMNLKMIINRYYH